MGSGVGSGGGGIASSSAARSSRGGSRGVLAPGKPSAAKGSLAVAGSASAVASGGGGGGVGGPPGAGGSSRSMGARDRAGAPRASGTSVLDSGARKTGAWDGAEPEEAPLPAGAGLGVLLRVRADQRRLLAHPEPERDQAGDEECHRPEAEALGVGQRRHRRLGAHQGERLQRLSRDAATERDAQRRLGAAGEERQAEEAERAGGAAHDDGALAHRRLAEGLGEPCLLRAAAGDELAGLHQPERGQAGLERHLVGGAFGEQRAADDEHPLGARFLVRAQQREGEEEVGGAEHLAGLTIAPGPGHRVGVESVERRGGRARRPARRPCRCRCGLRGSARSAGRRRRRRRRSGARWPSAPRRARTCRPAARLR